MELKFMFDIESWLKWDLSPRPSTYRVNALTTELSNWQWDVMTRYTGSSNHEVLKSHHQVDCNWWVRIPLSTNFLCFCISESILLLVYDLP